MANEPRTLEEIDAELAALDAEEYRRGRALRSELGARGPVTIETIDRELAALDAEERRRAQTPQQRAPRMGVAYRRTSPRSGFYDDPGGDQAPTSPPSRRGQSAPALEEIHGGLASFNRGVPFMTEAGAVLRGGLNVVGSLANDAPERPSIGNAFQQGYQRQMATSRAASDDFRARRPNAAAFTEGSGGALPAAAAILATGGAATPQVIAAQTASRGLPLFAQQTAKASAVGAGYGFVYGAGAGDAPYLSPEARLDRANEGAYWGAALGAATPTAVNAVRGVSGLIAPAWRALGRVLPRYPASADSGAGMAGRQVFSGGSRPPPPPPPRSAPSPLSPATQRRLPALADRARLTADELERAFADARARPGGQTLVDPFGDAGVRQLRPIVQSPGQTGDLAAETARQRFQAAPEIVLNSLRRNLAVSETRRQATSRLENEYAAASAENYNPLWTQPPTPRQLALYQERIAPLLDDPIVQDAEIRAQRIFARDRRLGLATGTFEENLARRLHYMKMAIDDAVSSATSRLNPSGAQATEARGINELRRQFVDAIDPPTGSMGPQPRPYNADDAIIPGYSAARRRWGGLSEAEEALDEGAQFLRMSADEVAGRVGEMSPFQLEHARIGIAHALTQSVGMAGSTVGNINIANIQAFRAPEMQRRIRAVFDTPEQAANFFDTTGAQNRLMRNAGAWGTGSQTQGNLAYEADGVMATAAEAAGHALGGNFGGAANALGRKIGNVILDGSVERSNNQFGADLLRRIDDPGSREFTSEVIRLLRAREAARSGASQASQAAATAAGANAPRDARDQGGGAIKANRQRLKGVG